MFFLFRFYIKCTACVSEICFRTDPASTDYVIEAGATRNFEALRKAEELAEKEENARKEELENNPMKLLEERTAASKNEMEIAESLDELRELNRRTVAIDYDSIISDRNAKLDQERRVRQENEEKKDEEFIKSIFSRVDGGDKIKRLKDDSDEDDDFLRSAPKSSKLDNPTDHLVEKKAPAQKAVWEKSIGTLTKKSGLGVLVKKKTTKTEAQVVTTPTTSEKSKEDGGVKSAVIKNSALGMLGNYSGSSDSASD